MRKLTKKQIEKEVERLNTVTNEDILNYVEDNLKRLKAAFCLGKEMTGEISVEDISYNIDLLIRVINYKFKK